MSHVRVSTSIRAHSGFFSAEYRGDTGVVIWKHGGDEQSIEMTRSQFDDFMQVVRRLESELLS